METNSGNIASRSANVQVTNDDKKLKTFQSSLNTLAHISIGCVVSACIMFSFRSGTPNGATLIHIALCVLGYQLLMSESILSLCPHNGWSTHLKLIHKRRAHWILQILGSGVAIVGSFIKIQDKSVHWNSLHGKFGLVALVFTSVSLFNGVASLWAYELRKKIPLPIILVKLTHICFGVVAYAASGICLCYGIDKAFFRQAVGDAMGYTLIGLTACFTAIIIINPCITFVTKITRK